MGAKDHGNEREDYSAAQGQGKEAESNIESARNSFSSQRATRVPKKIVRKEITDTNRTSRVSRVGTAKLQYNKTFISNNQGSPKKSPKQLNVSSYSHVARDSDGKKTETDAKESIDHEAVEFVTMDEGKEVVDVLDEAPNCDQSNSTDTETPDREEEPTVPSVPPEEKINDIFYRKMEELELKVENYEDELREAAAIEFSIYSAVAEHAVSGYEVHTPARRLSKVFVQACESFSQDKRASMTRSIISGLLHVAKSCGSDVSRLTFWLSNIIVLREIIAHQNSGKSSQRSRAVKERSADATKVSPLQWRNSAIGRPEGKSVQPPYVWHETSTVMNALKKIESWIFNRIVESVWWQALTPYMQSPSEKAHSPLSPMQWIGQYLGDRKQGNFAVNLWTVAFQDAFTRICPLRATGSKCGCLPSLAKLVMEDCTARLDVAMFNAILRESASEVPIDPVSDPISDLKVLPITPGDLSFSTGARLRNAIGNWSISLTEKFDKDVEDYREGIPDGSENDDGRKGTDDLKWFPLLRQLSELLMLPKDLLLETPIRQEVCPSFSLSLVTRVLCNFTPDEFCPDPVPSFVLDELNSESILDERSDTEKVTSIPCAASTISYQPPVLGNMAVELAIAEDATAKLNKKVPSAQMKGYSINDELKELGLPLSSFDDSGVAEMSKTCERYKLLQEIWYE